MSDRMKHMVLVAGLIVLVLRCLELADKVGIFPNTARPVLDFIFHHIYAPAVFIFWLVMLVVLICLLRVQKDSGNQNDRTKRMLLVVALILLVLGGLELADGIGVLPDAARPILDFIYHRMFIPAVFISWFVMLVVVICSLIVRKDSGNQGE